MSLSRRAGTTRSPSARSKEFACFHAPAPFATWPAYLGGPSWWHEAQPTLANFQLLALHLGRAIFKRATAAAEV